MKALSVSPYSIVLTLLYIAFQVASTLAQVPSTRIQTEPEKWGESPLWGDQGDGTYRNPVIPADFPDIDCIRVGPDYYAVSSTAGFSPGFVILHSKDLVNWSLLGHAVPDIGQIAPADPSDWNHIWAGAIRFHNNKFWIYFGTPREGYFMTTAPNPAGPWEPLHKMEGLQPAGAGWDDCCPFWDDDGQGYFVGTNFKDGNKIHIWRMTQDSRNVVSESDQVIHQSRGSEASKLYKINGTYYHFYSYNKNKEEGRVMMMERSQSILGPYRQRRQLTYGHKEFNQPNQGGLVQTEEGDWYFLTHHGSGRWEGRFVSLLPVTWVRRWPIIGRPDDKGIGEYVISGRKPVNTTPVVTPRTSDEFNGPVLPPQWQWNGKPRDDKWSLAQRPGWLRLYAMKGRSVGDALTQRAYRTAFNEVVIKLDISGMVEGQECGHSHMVAGSSSYAFLGISQEGARRTLVYEKNVESRPAEHRAVNGPAITGDDVWLRSTWGLDGLSRFSYSLDGKTFTEFGDPYLFAHDNDYQADRIAIICFNTKANAGTMDVDFFHYTYDHPMNTSSQAVK